MKIIPFFILLLLFVLSLKFVFVVRQVDCLLQGVSLEEGVCQQINKHFLGKSLFLTDFENASIWNELLGSERYSQAYQYQTVNKSLGGQIELTLVAKLPDYRLQSSQGSFLLNHSNKLRNDRADLSLPTIEAELEPVILANGYLGEDLHEHFFALSKALHLYGFDDSQVKWLSEQEIQLRTANLLVLLDSSKDYEYQIERLHAILSDRELAATLAAGQVLDLRFNLPVLKKY